MNKSLLLFLLLFSNCEHRKLTVITDLPDSLDEISAIQVISNSDLFWVIEDSGNKNHLYAIDSKGNEKKDITISNAKNTDWEDLTADNKGDIYIGDFGNNSKNREHFSILKIEHPEKISKTTEAKIINFKLPEGIKSKDFEAFFIWKNNFYIFSKEHEKFIVLKVANNTKNPSVKIISHYNLKGNHNRITSADISNDGKTIVLLNHDKFWKLTNFKEDDFFNGKIEALNFNHNSQKEGICFKNNKMLYITDEKTKSVGGNLYEFKLD